MDKSLVARYVMFFTIFMRTQKISYCEKQAGKIRYYRVVPVTRDLFELCMKIILLYGFVCFVIRESIEYIYLF